MAGDWIEITEAEALGVGEWEDISAEEIDLPTGGGLQEFGKGIVAGTLDVAKGITGTLETFAGIDPERARVTFRGFAPPVSMQLAPEEAARPFREVTEKIGAARERFPMTHRGASAWAGRVIGQAIPYMGAALAGGYMVGPAGAAMVGFSVEGQNAYESAIARGASEGEAQLERVIVGSVNAAIEAYQIKKLMKFHEVGKHSLRSFANSVRNKTWGKMWQSGKEFGADILVTSIEEGLEEFAQEGVSMVVPLALRGDYPVKDGKPDWLAIGERLGEALLGGFVAGGVLGGAGAGLIATGEAAAPSAKSIEAVTKRIRESKLGDFEKARLITDLEKDLMLEGVLRPIEKPIKAKGKVYYHGSLIAKNIFEGSEYFTDSAKEATAYAEMKALQAVIDENEELAEIVYDTMTEEGADEITDLGVDTIHDIIEVNKIKIEGKIGKGEVTKVELQYDNPLDLSDMGASIGSAEYVGQTWNELYEKGLLKEGPFESFDESIQQEIIDDYADKALYVLLDKENIYKNAFTQGYDAVIFTDQGLGGKTTHKTALVKSKTQIKLPGIAQQKIVDIFDIPESIRRRLEIAKKFEAELIEYEAKRPELKKEMKEAVHKKFGKIEEVRGDIETKDPIAASRVARAAAKGYARTLLPEFQEIFSRDEIVELAQAVRESNLPTGDYLTMSRFFEDILAGVQPHKSGIKLFDKFFGTNILQKGFRQRPLTKTQKLIQTAREPFNLLKAMVCSCDFSAGGIQALMVAPNHPVIWGKGVGKGYRAFFSPEYVQLAELEMKTDPRFDLISKYAPKLITEIGGGIRGEELFISELAHRIPIGIGKMVRASDRAFVTTLNNIRTNLFYQWCEQHGVQDINDLGGRSIAEIREVLDHIGNLTGRAMGKLGGRFEKYAPELGAAFWSPRLYLATARSMTDWATKPHIRKEAAADLLQAFGIGLMILALASLDPDLEVEFDPRSSDFAKIKRGNARITFFGQHTQMMRLVAQLVFRQKKATATGRIYHKDFLDIALRFMRSKLSPTAAVPIDVATGTTFLGKKMRWEPEFMEEYIAEKTVPMFLQDVVDAIRFQGLGTALWISPLAVHGIGAQIYEPTAGSEATRIKNHYAHQMYGTDWDELGPIVQQAIKLTRPAIESYERKARIERENFNFAKEMFEEQNETARRVYKSLPKNIQKDFDRLEVEIKDVSRRIGSNWFLNKKRYKQYEEDLKKLLKRVVPQPMKSPGWNRLDENIQREILQALVDQCRKHVRQQIILKANIEDVMRR